MRQIGIVGAGVMGRAIAERLVEKGGYAIRLFDKDPSRLEDSAHTLRASSLAEAVGGMEAVIIAVKPQDFDVLLTQLAPLASARTVYISIAAGITCAYIEARMQGAKVVRVMPNLPARIGRGMITICAGEHATDEECAAVERIFSVLGQTLILTESIMDAATALSGSGPGFFFYLLGQRKDVDAESKEAMEAFAKNGFFPDFFRAATEIGFNVEEAKLLSVFTIDGSIALRLSCRQPLDTLIGQVASRGGTTEAGLQVLAHGGSLIDAVKAALQRARALAKRG
jgi:pyrroline-5-carboxylate reductase